MLTKSSQTLPNSNTVNRTELKHNSIYKQANQRQYQSQIFSFESTSNPMSPTINTTCTSISQTFYNQEVKEELPSPEVLLNENPGLISSKELPILESKHIEIFSDLIVASSTVIGAIL